MSTHNGISNNKKNEESASMFLDLTLYRMTLLLILKFWHLMNTFLFIISLESHLRKGTILNYFFFGGLPE